MDICVSAGAENEMRVIEVIREFAFPASILRNAGPIVPIHNDDIEIPMISLDELKRNKRASGLTKDLLDLEELP
jgi:hypothetical protein